jgi:peptidoglycan/LPS O-acetylase OafA/YrhL
LIPGQLLFYAMAMGLTLAVAMLSWALFEQPILRLKRFFGEPRSPLAAGPAGQREPPRGEAAA